MKAMVEELYREQMKNGKGPSHGKGEGGGDDPLETPPSPSSPSTSSSSSIPQRKQPGKTDSNLSLLNLDVKFDFPMYNGKLNAKKLDNWIHQIEVYYRVQRIIDEEEKVQLATLRLGGTTLI
jgi:hypothetical protein